MAPASRGGILALVVSLVVAAAPARANVTTAGYGEPNFTKGTANTWFFNWSNPGAVTKYYLVYTMNSASIGQTAGLSGSSGTASIGRSGLVSGSTYDVCATEYYDSPGLAGYYMPHVTACESTKVDNSSPSVGASINGTDDYTNNPSLNLVAGYADSISAPFWYFDAYYKSAGTETYDCFALGGACTATFTDAYYDPGCSVLANPYGRYGNQNYVACTLQWSGGDGKIYWCPRMADSAFPDRSTSSDQLSSFEAGQFNVSPADASTCGWITLDRQPPSVQASANAASVTVGQLVSLNASATDNASGVAGGFDWDFGDNTAHGAGAAVTHSYTQTGTFQAKATVHDTAGNAGQGTVTITVNPQGTPAGGQTGSSTQQVSGNAISQQNGGGGSQTTTVSGLKIIAPKKFRAGRKAIVVGLVTKGAGTARLMLKRGKRTLAKAGRNCDEAGSYAVRLRVPRKLKAGIYKLTVAFRPIGSRRTISRTFKVKVLAARHGKALVKVVPGSRAATRPVR